ncbi:hypothetical protein PS662_02895 [Pseudomonas fluorescens]|uniref:Uncharacterized protein n=1 Tax=Pseudomonas fluorescens TaxID=294 RepID=A0A5E6TWK6_PSEFL|nr:hypothetical protein [Pseudomonas fluorescens]VVM39975.1 hypothetical protein PS662_00232 [Pseudomonas fluorescens]VVM92308.1 hypothetical protein PS662_02895 [Pseudomonas fluorescens]
MLDAYEDWSRWLDTARRKLLPGDMLVLAEEAPTVALRIEAKSAAGEALLKFGQWDFAREQFDAVLALDPDNRFAREKKALCLARPDRKVVEQETTLGESAFEPRQVFLFSGHMIDTADRAVPRFPADKEAIAAASIAAALDRFGGGPGDLALAQGANGGDLLFLEACQQRGIRLQLMLPLPEPEFIERSLLPSCGGEQWRDRYCELKRHLHTAPRIMPDELGLPPESSPEKVADPFERCNLWLLFSALAWGGSKVRFICLWNGSGGDGPGGTSHMYEEMKRRTGRVAWLDTRDLW